MNRITSFRALSTFQRRPHIRGDEPQESRLKEDIKKIKKMAIDLLQRIKNKISNMDHWTDKQETKDSVDILIRDVLFAEIPDCMFNRLDRNVIFEHVYTHYRQVVY